MNLPLKPAQELTLYPHQVKIVNELREALAIDKRVILMGGTGLGKTFLSAWIIQKARENKKKCLFIADRIQLVEQTSEVFDMFGISHGIIQSDHWRYSPGEPVQVASVQTLARRKVGNYDVILMDEVHTFHNAHAKVIAQNEDAYIIGLTATPYSVGLGKHFARHIEPIPVRKLIEDGHLASYEAYGPSSIDVSKLKVVAGEYSPDSLSAEADRPQIVGDVVSTWKKLADGRQSVVYAVDVKHSKHLCKEFNRHRIRAVEINGYMPPDERKEALDAFASGEAKVFCSCEILVKGFSDTSVSCVVLATATKSITKLTQCIGRGLRKHPGKDKCIVIDHGGNIERLGFPEEYEFLHLDDGTKISAKERKRREKEQEEKAPKPCPSCHFLRPAGVRKCPACGLIPAFMEDVPTEEGELKKLARKAKAEYSLAQKQEFLAGLNAHCHKKGYRQGRNGCFGWAINAYQEKFGTDIPSRLDWGKIGPIGDDVKKFIRHKNIRWAKSKEASSVA